MRVLSLVPRAVADIRDASTMTFGDIEAARFRATVARVASWIALAFALVFAALALVRASRPFRAKAPGVVKQVRAVCRPGRVRGGPARRARRGVVRGRVVGGSRPACAAGAAARGRVGLGPARRAAEGAPRCHDPGRSDSRAARLDSSQAHRALGLDHADPVGRGRRARGTGQPHACRAGRTAAGARGLQQRGLRRGAMRRSTAPTWTWRCRRASTPCSVCASAPPGPGEC